MIESCYLYIFRFAACCNYLFVV